jgi:hypothetical protein
MLSQQRQSGSQPGDPLNGGIAKQFQLVAEEFEGAIGLSEVMPPPLRGDNQTWRLLLISLLSCFAASGAALGAFFWLINLPPTANCDDAATVTTDRAQLFCAQLAAGSGDLSEVTAALALVGGWTAAHPLHYEVQPLIEQWSWVVLNAAEQELRSQGSMAEAKALIGYIPPHSPVFAQAEATLANWQTEWAEGEALVTVAQTALQQRDWATASQQMQALAALNNPHWQVDRAQALARQIRQERRAQELLDVAIATAAPGGSDNLGAALRTASQISEDTYAHQHAQPYLNRWSDLLLKLGLDKWYTSDLTTAIALGRSAALNPARAQRAQELIWLSEARQLAQQSLVTWRTAPDQLVTLYQAMLVANRVPRESPYHPQAQSSVATWRRHLGDLAQLQMAQAVGQVRQIDAYQVAIDQAAKVPLGHPRRIQAQTLVAHWRQEIERIEDRPYLVKAHALASSKTVDGLRAAIETANTVPLHRALRGEAQSWAYVWTNELQVIEDRPRLTQARSMAAQGQLSQAIVEASGVQRGRALYEEAQGAIADWQRQIAAAEQTRQRVLQRAAARPEDPSPWVNLEPATVVAPEPFTAPHPTPAASAPGIDTSPLRSPLPQRTPLPERIETIPDTPSPALEVAPVVPPRPLVAPPTVEAATPEPVLTPAPIPAPMPLPVVPPAPLVPVPSGAGTPTPDIDPQATAPVSPAISARPQPEKAEHVVLRGWSSEKTQGLLAWEEDVLATGSLYVGY